jgi:hypothetical protein
MKTPLPGEKFGFERSVTLAANYNTLRDQRAVCIGAT